MKTSVRLLAATAALLACIPCAVAQTIGAAATIRNQVTGNNSPLGQGDSVVRNEAVVTGADSDARLVFVDKTNLAVGPKSKIILDKFVYADPATYSKAVVNLAVGSFRFTTGGSPKAAYEINTPTAAIGVRGTILDILSKPSSTEVLLQEGAAKVCARSGGKCVELVNVGDRAIVTKTATNTQVGISAKPGWTFASACSKNPSLCGTSTVAQAFSPASTGMAALCGK